MNEPERLECGWWWLVTPMSSRVAAMGENPVRAGASAALVLQYDPESRFPSHGVKMLALTAEEALRVSDRLAEVARRAVYERELGGDDDIRR